jgi:type II secretory pathway component PulK
VYVLKDKPDAIRETEHRLVVDTHDGARIPINTCSVEELAAHPYRVEGGQASDRLPRSAWDHSGAWQDIKACQAVGEDVFRKLAPYLTVE